MKAIANIILIIIVLTVQTGFGHSVHYCGGEIADEKISFLPVNVGCGMEKINSNFCSTEEETSLKKSNCCKDELEFHKQDLNLNQLTKDYSSNISIDLDLDLIFNVVPNLHYYDQLVGSIQANAPLLIVWTLHQEGVSAFLSIVQTYLC